MNINPLNGQGADTTAWVPMEELVQEAPAADTTMSFSSLEEEIEWCMQAAVKQENNNNFYMALSLYTSVIELDNKNIIAYLNRADIHIKLNDYVASAIDIMKAIELDPNYSDAYLACLLYTSNMRKKLFICF